jgi:P2 family phage contractile tail tube protein
MESANLYCGKSSKDQGASNHLTLTEIQLPMLEEQYVEHRAGGAPVAIEIDTVVGRLEATFAVIGWTPQISQLFHSWATDDNYFTMYGVVRDRVSGDAQQAVSLMKGRLARSAPTNWRRGDVLNWNYSIKGITHYELALSGAGLIYFWDFFTNTLQVGGSDRNANTNSLLATGAVHVSPLIAIPQGMPPTGGA